MSLNRSQRLSPPEEESNPLLYFPTFDQWLFMKMEIDSLLPSLEHAKWMEERIATQSPAQLYGWTPLALGRIPPPPDGDGWEWDGTVSQWVRKASDDEEEDEEDGA